MFSFKTIIKYLPKRENTHANVLSCPSNEYRELFILLPDTKNPPIKTNVLPCFPDSLVFTWVILKLLHISTVTGKYSLFTNSTNIIWKCMLYACMNNVKFGIYKLYTSFSVTLIFIQNRTEGLFPYKHIIYKYMWSSHYWLMTQNNIIIIIIIYIYIHIYF